MYKEKQFRIRSTEDVIADLERARGFASSIKRIFFADGDAFIRKSEEQLKISAAVKRIPRMRKGEHVCFTKKRAYKDG